MKKIELKNIKVGDYFYIVDEGEKSRRFMVKKLINDKEKHMYEWWRLENKSEKGQLPEIDTGKVSAKHLNNYQFSPYTLYRLNKKEISEFKKLIIIFNLK